MAYINFSHGLLEIICCFIVALLAILIHEVLKISQWSKMANNNSIASVKSSKKSFIINYSTKEPFNHEDFTKRIMELFEEWGCISENSFVVLTELNPSEILKKILPSLPEDTRIFVCKVQRNAAWRYSICSNDWINENLNVL